MKDWKCFQRSITTLFGMNEIILSRYFWNLNKNLILVLECQNEVVIFRVICLFSSRFSHGFCIEWEIHLLSF